jgi:hypothetical protein
MSIETRVREGIKKAAFGKTLLPQEFTLGLPDPQTEITVFLRGAGLNREVTEHVSTACAEPLTICIGFDEGTCPSGRELSGLTLVFSERKGLECILGEIGLDYKRTLTGVRTEFMFFEPKSSKNFCLPNAQLGLHYLLHIGSRGGITRREFRCRSSRDAPPWSRSSALILSCWLVSAILKEATSSP